MKIFLEKLRYKCVYLKREAQRLWGMRNYLSCTLWGIDIGKRSFFRGKAYFKKHPGSKIIIGDNFTCFNIINESGLVKRPCTIQTNTESAVLEIGNNVGISGGVIACFKHIKIGNNVKVGGNVSIFDGDFHLDDPRSGTPKDIIIGDNVWIGYESIILKGVSIGNNSVIGAGSVVTKDIPDNTIAAGNPCKIIKTI